MLDGATVLATPAGVLGLVALTLLGLVGFSVRAVLSGRLIPRNVHDEAVARERAETEKWHQAWGLSEETRREVADQNRQLLALGETSVTLLRAFTGGGPGPPQ
jgi:Tfp pilus assembly protein PilX